MSREFICKKIPKGKMGGEVILSNGAACFYTVKPETGKVIESNYHLKDKNIVGKILVMPSRKGSSVVQVDGLYKLQLRGKAPKAITVQHADTVLAPSTIIMKTLMVYKVKESFYQETKDGTRICVDADNGKITIF